MSRTTLRRLGQALILTLVVWLVARELSGSWGEFRTSIGAARPRWSLIALSAAAVLAVYAVQIHAWRTLVGAWGDRLAFWRAARVWAVSNLSRFAPASVLVTTGVIGALGARAGVPAAAAAGSAVLGTLLNIGTGAVIVVALGGGLLRQMLPQIPEALSVAAAVTGGLGLLAVPFFVGPALTLAGRLIRRPLEVPPLPLSAIATAVTANLVAWFLYGAAFLALARAFFPSAGGNWVSATAVFTGAYIAGWLTFVVPGGYGVREAILTIGVSAVGMLRPAEAAVVVIASRLLTTVLEVLPGATFLARDALLRNSPRPDGSR